MRIKVFFVLAILSIISCAAKSQVSDYRNGMGLIGHSSVSGMINNKQYGNPGSGSFQIFSSVYRPAEGLLDFESERQPVANRMTPASEISAEQV